jgi:hypothetical protein
VEGEGHPLQLYSYFYNDDIDDAFIDGNIVANASFWSRAYAREMIFISNEDPSDLLPVSGFFVNNNAYLYIALSWNTGNANNANGIWVFFDEGDNAGSGVDGNHDDGLTNPSFERNEDGLFADRGGSNLDLNWDASGNAWQTDTSSNKILGVDNFGAGGAYYNAEFKIPLNTGNDDTDDSNLDVSYTDEIGIYFVADVIGGGSTDSGHYYWDRTTVQQSNKNTIGDYEPLVADSTTNQWGDLKLGLQRDETKLYSTVNINGAPIVDGDISNDIAWINSYKREMKFTNFKSETLDVKFYSIQDQGTKDIWCGFRVEDDDYNANDEFYIFQERETAFNPGTDRDFMLDTDYENLIYIDVGGTWSDWEYDSGTWNADDADTQGNAAVQHLPSPTPHYEFEFEIPYDGGAEDLNMDDNGLFGFFMKFVDSDLPAGEQEFFWEMTANSELLRIDEPDSTHVSVGWVDLQMGGPAVSPVQPDDGGVVSGTEFRFRVYAEDEGGINEINFVAFKTENMDTFKNLFQEPGTGFWSTFWDTTSEPNGPTRITIVAQDNELITVYIYITVIISNAGAGGNPPSGVSITSPPAPGPYSGVVVFDASAIGATNVEFYIDGVLFEADDTDPYQATLDTKLYSDGGHTISVRAVNIAGETWDAKSYEFNNWDLNSFTITNPTSGTTQSGAINVIGDFAADNSGDYAELYIDDMFWSFSDDTASGTVTFALDTTLLSEGAHQLKMFIYDPEGNKLMDMVTIYVDNWDLNSLTITNPASGTTQMGPINVIGDFAADNSGEYAELYVDDVFWSYSDDTALGDVTFALDTNLLSEGEHQLKMFVYDPEGNKLTDMVTIYVDNIAPDTPTVVSVIDEQFIEGVFVFQVQCDTPDLIGIDITVTNDDLSSNVITAQTLGFNSISGYYEFALDTRVLVDGNYSVIVEARDSSGTTQPSLPMNFNIDNNAPMLTVSSPMDNSMVSGDVNFESTTKAKDAFLMGIMYKVDGNSWMGINETWDTTTYPDGNHMVMIMAADYLGHESMVTLNLVMDNNGPTVDIINPFEDQFVMGIFTFRVAATDEVGVKNVHITLTNSDTTEMVMEDQAVPYNSATGHYEYTLDTDSIIDGNYTFSCTSYDIYDQSSGDESVDFMIDNNAPELVIESPLCGNVCYTDGYCYV